MTNSKEGIDCNHVSPKGSGLIRKLFISALWGFVFSNHSRPSVHAFRSSGFMALSGRERVWHENADLGPLFDSAVYRG